MKQVTGNWVDHNSATMPAGQTALAKTDAGNSVSVWKGRDNNPYNEKFFCHGFSLNTFDDFGYTVFSGEPMEQVLYDEYDFLGFSNQLLDPLQSGDIAVWVNMRKNLDGPPAACPGQSNTTRP